MKNKYKSAHIPCLCLQHLCLHNPCNQIATLKKILTEHKIQDLFKLFFKDFRGYQIEFQLNLKELNLKELS